MTSENHYDEPDLIQQPILTPQNFSVKSRIGILVDETISRNSFLVLEQQNNIEFIDAKVAVKNQLYELRKRKGVSSIVDSKFRLDESDNFVMEEMSPFDRAILKFPIPELHRYQTIKEVLIAWKELKGTPMIQIIIMTLLLDAFKTISTQK